MITFGGIWTLIHNLEPETWIGYFVAAYALLLRAMMLVTSRGQRVLDAMLRRPAEILRVYHRTLIYFFLALGITSIAPLYEKAIYEASRQGADAKVRLSDLFVNNQLHALHFGILFLTLAFLGRRLQKRTLEQEAAPSVERVTGYFAAWGSLYGTTIIVLDHIFPATL